VLVATTNPGKIREIRIALAGAPVSVRTLAEFSAIAEPKETGATFAENAELKARYYFAATHKPTVAEDSGLVIDALGGRPGVLSSRYPGATYGEKFNNLYLELASHSRPWTARFVCALALVGRSVDARHPEERLHFSCEATVEGEIAFEPQGSNGFGYDPILFYPPLGRTLGELTDHEKLEISHRGKAFGKFRHWLVDELGSLLAH
jgi:XTP/dITP diphosphohydrolase